MGESQMSKNIKSGEISRRRARQETDTTSFEGEKALRKSGIDIIGDVSWGMHLCVFYQSKEDLIDILVPYFKTGLENNEFCVWVTSGPLTVEEAKSSLKKAIENLDDYIAKGQIDILDYSQWYTKSGKFEADKILQGWVEKEAQALKNGFDGLRVTGNTSWLEKNDWKKFADYEATVNNVIGKYRMISICTHSLDKCNACEIIEVVNNHQFALIKKEDKWMILASSERKRVEEALRESEARYTALFTSAAEGIVAADLETMQFCYANPAMCRMFGYTEEELMRLGVADIHPKESLDYVLAEFEAQARGEKTLANDLPCLHKDGTLFYANVSAAPIVLDGRKCNVGFFTDVTERKEAEESLKEYDMKLRDQNLALDQKNLALKEMIEHIERTKNKMKEDIAINIDETITPIVEKLKIKGVSPKYIKLFQYHLKELTSSFGRKITQKSTKLTPREIEICNMIKSGLSSKDLAELLNVSQQTIEKHRKNIRKKLGLSSKKANLTSYLQSI